MGVRNPALPTSVRTMKQDYQNERIGSMVYNDSKVSSARIFLYQWLKVIRYVDPNTDYTDILSAKGARFTAFKGIGYTQKR
jgi:hypothetical protein